MDQENWTGIVRLHDDICGWHFAGNTVLRDAVGTTVAGVEAQLGQNARIVVTGGIGTQAVPAAILPSRLPLSDLEQAQPRGLIDAVARLLSLGAIAARPNWDGVICVQMHDATHWCQISAGEMVSFQSAVTPLLARALTASDQVDPEAMNDTMSRPERLAVHLRTAQLNGSDAALTGHLLGAELAAMRAYWLGQRMITVGSNRLYADALSGQGVPVTHLSPLESARDGLIALRMLAI